MAPKTWNTISLAAKIVSIRSSSLTRSRTPTCAWNLRRGLPKGEARHSLAHAVFAHSQGCIRDRSDAAQQKRAMALNLVISVIIFWNTTYMDKAASQLSKTSTLYYPAVLPFTSPLGWDHIILSGDFDWHSGSAERKIARPLHIRSTRD